LLVFYCWTADTNKVHPHRQGAPRDDRGHFRWGGRLFWCEAGSGYWSGGRRSGTGTLFTVSRPGRARQLCPGISDVNFLRDLDRIVDLDAEIADSALDLGVAKQELHGP